jgi:hypothetical protein
MSESRTSKVAARARPPRASATTAAGIAAERVALAGRDRERQIAHARTAAGRRDGRIAGPKP